MCFSLFAIFLQNKLIFEQCGREDIFHSCEKFSILPLRKKTKIIISHMRGSYEIIAYVQMYKRQIYMAPYMYHIHCTTYYKIFYLLYISVCNTHFCTLYTTYHNTYLQYLFIQLFSH